MLNFLYKVPLITRIKTTNGKVGRKYANFELTLYARAMVRPSRCSKSSGRKMRVATATASANDHFY